jgi:hypothetical protein
MGREGLEGEGGATYVLLKRYNGTVPVCRRGSPVRAVMVNEPKTPMVNGRLIAA